MTTARIEGLASYFPEKIIMNADFEKTLETTDQWIVERTGIHQRRRSEPHETPGFMGARAAEKLLQQLGKSPDEIDLIVVATITGDYSFPASASIIQNELKAKNCWGFDLSGACSGYLYAIEVARSMIESNRHQNVLVIAAEKMSTILDYQDRSTCVLFGDAGSATWVSASSGEEGIIDSQLHLDGSGIEYLYAPIGGSRTPLTAELIEKRDHFAKQDGRNVYKRAVVDMAEVSAQLLEKNNLTGEDIALYVPHQANLRIIESAAERLKMPMEKVMINLDRYGNTTAATIPTALDEALQTGKVKKGDLVLMASFGAGFTWGATLIRL